MSYTLVTGDCHVALLAMQAQSVDAVITDPPYNETNRNSHGHGALRNLDKGGADSPPVRIGPLAIEFARVSRGWVYVWCGFEQVGRWRRAFRKLRMPTRVGVWWKTDPSPMNGEFVWLSAIELCVIAKHPRAPFYRRCAPPVWRGPTDREVTWHPTPKPVWLMRELITASVPHGGLVLDPFMGSASVGVAALLEGREFAGIELSSDWAEPARLRLSNTPLNLFHQSGA